MEQQPTFNLLPLHLEGAALGLDRLLQADDGGALLLEGLLLVRARDAESYQFALELRELNVPLFQRLLCRLASGMLPLERRPGVGESGPLLLKLPLSPLAGGALLQELALRGGERRGLGVEGGLLLVGLLGLLLSLALPLLGLALLGLRLPEPCAPSPRPGSARPAPPGATRGPPDCRPGRCSPLPPSWMPTCASSPDPTAPAAAPYPDR
jgi:hypothetical protein